MNKNVLAEINEMIIEYNKPTDSPPKWIEEIMYGIQREVINKMVDCAVIAIIDTIHDNIRECFGTTEDHINELVYMFNSKLPEAWRCKFTVPKAG